jgi:tRNA A-37 threonylcarbamoyl transferase component Bud32
MFVGEIALHTVVKVKEISTSILLKMAKGLSENHFLGRSGKVFVIGLVAWLVAVTAGYIVYHSEVQSARNALYQQGVGAVNDLATKCGPFLLEKDVLALNLQLKELDQLNYFKYAAIIDHTNSVVAQSGADVGHTTPDTLKSQKKINVIDGVAVTARTLPDKTRIIGLFKPITYSGVDIGQVYLALSTDELYGIISQWRWKYGGALALITVLLAAVVLWSGRSAKPKAVAMPEDLAGSPNSIGPYQLLHKIAHGGMAELYLANYVREDRFRKRVAVKRILPHLAENPEFITMFVREARLAALLQHPNIVQIFDFGKIDHNYFIAMEYIDGKNLGEILTELQGGLPIDPAVFIISRVCKGLFYSHTILNEDTAEPLNIVHRDISPQNILVSYEGEVKISDFGISKASSEPSLTQAGVIKGKMAYMAPEQALGLDVDHRTDIYALGLVFHELLSGKRVYKFSTDIEALHAIPNMVIEPIKKLAPHIPDELNRIIMKCLERERENRYQTAMDLYTDLSAFERRDNITYDASELAEFMKLHFKKEPV